MTLPWLINVRLGLGEGSTIRTMSRQHCSKCKDRGLRNSLRSSETTNSQSCSAWYLILSDIPQTLPTRGRFHDHSFRAPWARYFTKRDFKRRIPHVPLPFSQRKLSHPLRRLFSPPVQPNCLWVERWQRRKIWDSDNKTKVFNILIVTPQRPLI